MLELIKFFRNVFENSLVRKSVKMADKSFGNVDETPGSPPKISVKRSASAAVNSKAREKYQSSLGIKPREGLFRTQSASGQGSTLYVGIIAFQEKQILQYIQTFPTVIQQQTKGTDFIASWNWYNILQRHKREAEAAKDNSVKQGIIRNLFISTKNLQNLLQQINHDFAYGLRKYNPNPQDIVNKICIEIEVVRAGTRGRNTFTDNIIPYMADIFQTELKKQQKYSSIRILTDAKVVKQRNEVVNWVIHTTKTLKYPAELAHIAIYIIDAYMSVRLPSKFMLLGVTALHIAGKLEEPAPANVDHLIKLSGHCYEDIHVYKMEEYILNIIKFDVNPPLAPLFAQMVLIGGTLVFPTIHMRKLALDISTGILFKSLLNHKLVSLPPAEKAKAALETAVEFLFSQYSICSNRNMSLYKVNNSDPGQALGDFMLSLATDAFNQRFVNKKLVNVIPAQPACTASPVRNLKV